MTGWRWSWSGVVALKPWLMCGVWWCELGKMWLEDGQRGGRLRGQGGEGEAADPGADVRQLPLRSQGVCWNAAKSALEEKDIQIDVGYKLSV